MNTRQSYHTNIKILTQFNLLSRGIYKQIPKSNISRWKNIDLSSVFGIEQYQEHIDTIKELMKHKKFLKSCLALLRIKNALIEVYKNNRRKKIKDVKLKEIIVYTIDRVRQIIGFDRAVKYFKITIQQYYAWAHQIKKKCLETIIDQCPRIYPNQLCKKEIEKIKECLWDIKYRGWAIYSIAWECIKKGTLFVSPGSWYKYAKILGFTKKLPQSRRKYPTGIRAEKVVEKIHADVTIFKPLDNIRIYIYLIMDNHSRYIFAWKASLMLSAEIFVENLKEAYKRYISPFYRGKPIELIVDGGSENNNYKVDDFLEDIDGNIKKLIAQLWMCKCSTRQDVESAATERYYFF